MSRLRTVNANQPGWTRRRSGRGFRYLDRAGNALPVDQVERIKALAIPPAWRDVWICPHPNGHLQAVGTDDAGRRQYLYHPQWRIRRDRLKFDRVLAAATHLPSARRRIARDLALQGMPMDRATALAVRLIDLGCFRIGSDAYADANGSFGLTTLRPEHVRRTKEGVVFAFTGKSRIEHTITIDDAEAIAALDRLRRRRRNQSGRLLAYQVKRAWVDLDAATVNAYLSALFDGELTAKDFRTWHATVIAAASLAMAAEASTKAARRRAVKAAVQEVADYLGNTPTVAKNSYIDPRVIDLYEAGTVAAIPAMGPRTSPARRQQALEKAVLELLS